MNKKKGYIELTGFNDRVPTAIEDLAFGNQLSVGGFRSYIDALTHIFLNTGNLRNDSFTFACGIKVANVSNYLEGTMCVTVKRDIIGLPLIFMGNFLPYKKV